MGRPKGSKDTRPRTTAGRRDAYAARLGLKVLPLDVMTKVMDYWWFKAVDGTSGAIKDEAAAVLAFSYAERCAPYLHGRASPAEGQGQGNVQILVTFNTPAGPITNGPINRGDLVEARALPETGSGDILP